MQPIRTSNSMAPPLVEVRHLRIEFPVLTGTVIAVADASFSVAAGRTLCLVGESGCGKSATARALLQIIERPGRITGGEVVFAGTGERIDIARLPPGGSAMRALRWREIAMVFQEPMTSLSPVHTIGNQIVEAIRLHADARAPEARSRTIELLRRVGMPDPETRIDAYPFRLSGGMRQRAMIAMALAAQPKLLIADEPTTALDVTTQATILDLLRDIRQEFGMAMLFITHDFGVVAEIADDVAVMYLGHIVERGPVAAVMQTPLHPYTRGLLASRPQIGRRRGRPGERLPSIPGMVPGAFDRPTGCPFHTRCAEAMPGLCDVSMPPPVQLGETEVRCHLHTGALA
jgi:oligopeptide/dipeptide ABC transporter ATP-binding protein